VPLPAPQHPHPGRAVEA